MGLFSSEKNPAEKKTSKFSKPSQHNTNNVEKNHEKNYILTSSNSSKKRTFSFRIQGNMFKDLQIVFLQLSTQPIAGIYTDTVKCKVRYIVSKFIYADTNMHGTSNVHLVFFACLFHYTQRSTHYANFSSRCIDV